MLDNKQIFIFFILWIVGMHQLVDSEVYYLQYISVWPGALIVQNYQQQQMHQICKAGCLMEFSLTSYFRRRPSNPQMLDQAWWLELCRMIDFLRTQVIATVSLEWLIRSNCSSLGSAQPGLNDSLCIQEFLPFNCFQPDQQSAADRGSGHARTLFLSIKSRLPRLVGDGNYWSDVRNTTLIIWLPFLKPETKVLEAVWCDFWEEFNERSNTWIDVGLHGCCGVCFHRRN